MGLSEIVIDAATILGPTALNKLKNYIEKPHGSKVKEGAFKDCTIELAGDKAFIVATAEKGEIVCLTSEYIQSYQFVKEKQKLHRGKFKTYYYYKITFKDGSESYVRMRKKYCKAMKKYTQIQGVD